MHICYVAIDFHQAGQGGGIASYTLTLGQELVRRGHRVTLIGKGSRVETYTLDEQGQRQPDTDNAPGIHVLVWPFGNLSWYVYRLDKLGLLNNLIMLPLRELEWSRSIQRAIRTIADRTPIDVIEGGESGNQFIPGAVIRTHGSPYTFARHTHERLTPSLRLSHQLELRALRRARLVTAPSRFQATELGAELGWSPTRIQAIPNPVPAWALDAVPTTPPADSEAPIILYVGRIQTVKGSLILLESVAQVARVYPTVRFVLAGARHLSISAAMLAQRLAAGGVAEHVILPGHVDWQQLADWYRKAAIFVMPSYFESFCIACVEAMAFGLPVVATTAGGLPEVVEDGVTGVLVPPGDVTALSEALVALLRDSERRRQMGQAGRERVQRLFSAAHVADQTLAAYATLRQDVS